MGCGAILLRLLGFLVGAGCITWGIIVMVQDVYVETCGWNNYEHPNECADEGMLALGISLIVGGAIILEIVIGDLLILWVRPQDPASMTHPRQSDIKAHEFAGLTVNLSASIDAGWQAFKNTAGPSFCFTLLIFIILILVVQIPYVGAWFAVMAQIMASCAFMMVYQKYLRGEEVTFYGFFSMSNISFDAVLATIVASFAALFAMIPSVFFGIYLRLTFSMIICVAMDPKMAHLSVIEIMLASRKIFHYHAWKLFGFNILSFFILLLGALCLGVGVFAAIPTIMYAQADIYYSHRHNGGLPVYGERSSYAQVGETNKESAPLLH
jgi:hypothetical protein